MSDSSESADLEALLDLEFEFRKQPDPVAPSLRPKRRLALLVLMLAKSRGSRLSWKGLQVLSWALRDPRNMSLFIQLDNGIDTPDLPIVRIEPALDRAVDLALGLGLIIQLEGRAFQLTADGVRLAGDIERSDVFGPEKAQLARVKGKITQVQVNRLLEWRAQ